MRQKTHQPVQFEITEQARASVMDWIKKAKLKSEDFLFPNRIHESPHITTRQYARIVEKWVASIGLNHADYGTHSFRRTKTSLIYRKTKTFGQCNCC
jgi:integrase